MQLHNDRLTTTLPANASIGPYPYYNFRKLGESEGYMSEVYLVHTLPKHQLAAHKARRRETQVVIKIARVMDKKQGKYNAEALLRENRWLQQLNHPAIVQILPICQANGHSLAYSAQSNLPGNPWFTVLESLRGGTLAKLLEDKQPAHPAALDLALVLRIIYLLASALDYLHQRGLAHLDIKPRNILFRAPPLATQRVEPVLIDFGLVGNIGKDPVKARTPAYSAPERLCNDAPCATAAMDIYALGIVFYEMLAGVHPFAARSEAETIAAISSGHQPSSPFAKRTTLDPEIVRRLDDLVLRMLNYAPEVRPSATAICRETRLLLLELGEDMFPVQSAQIALPIYQRWALPLFSLLLAVILLLMVMIFATPSAARSEHKAATNSTQPSQVITHTPQIVLRPPLTSTTTLQAVATVTPTAIAPPTPTLIAPTTLSPERPMGSAFVNSPITIALDKPNPGEAGKGKIRFSWAASRAPSAGQAYEIVFWPINVNPTGNPNGGCKAGECYVIASNIQTKEFNDDIDLSLIVNNGKMPANTAYSWGVRVVQQNKLPQPLYLIDDQSRVFYLQG